MATRLSVITTRTGDAGETGLGDGSRIGKDAPRIAALGDVDELNSSIGLLRTHDLPDDLDTLLDRIQHDLFDLGAELSIPGHRALHDEHVAALDHAIQHHNSDLGTLREFILPGGSREAAHTHVSRAVCRRAERSVVAVERAGDAINAPLRQYLNRLSDLLFVLARVLNRRSGRQDVLWDRSRIDGSE